MERKSPLFHEKACAILDEIFEEESDNDGIVVIPFQPPAANSEIGAEPMEIDSAPSTQIPDENPVEYAIVEDPMSSNSCGSPVGSDEADEAQDNEENEENEEDVVVMAKPCSYISLYRHKTCEGCMRNPFAPDQKSHMQYGGCLADPINDDEDDEDVQ